MKQQSVGCVKKERWVFTRKLLSAGQAQVGFALDVDTSGGQVRDWEEPWSKGCSFSFHLQGMVLLGPRADRARGRRLCKRGAGPLAAAGMASTGKMEPSVFLLAPLLCC